MFTEDTPEGLVEQLAIYAEFVAVMGPDLDKATHKAIAQDVRIIKARIKMSK